MLEILQIPVLTDNYIYLIHDESSDEVAVVDPAVADPVIDVLEERGWSLSHILNTHHHFDHVGANLDLKSRYNVHIIGPAADQDRIPGIDIPVSDGDTVHVCGNALQVFDVPGHTKGHIAYFDPVSNALFCGDTLFAMGCGRLFEGTPEQMWTSLQKFRDMPDDTLVCCAHEYTLANGLFALSLEPNNPALLDRMEKVKTAREKGMATVPSRLGDERRTNPFLRADDPVLQSAVAMPDADPVAVFTEIRARKDIF
ncbi:hydroxyacylglutathione hydrolase [Kordiimonas sediminis]|uniref:Hydroxyacylglutathione hydrolase n=1 Tax=Kordiimonas sediminis TaxID=1735581 RepID=A0A919APL8_9PROT|nr:hydroxyacylglutathione hydrolase [Kordiimonas sediminis]GHF17201.1 hydroxyacylglutathione hydrolase [Kordiimonas sediminis]